MSSCCKMYLEYLNDQTLRHGIYKIPCGSWACPECRLRNQAKMRKKFTVGIKGYFLLNRIDPGKMLFHAKFLTLTLPGDEWRSNYTPAQAEVILKKNYRKLRDRMKKEFSGFEFLSVDELQPSGYPHIHVLILGPGIASKGVLEWVRGVWCGKYGMGNIDIQVVKQVEGVAHYMAKYLSKQKEGVLKKGNRVYMMSRGLNDIWNSYKKERSSHITVLAIGRIDSMGNLKEPFWKKGEEVDSPTQRLLNNFQELMTFFEDKANGVCEQSKLWGE